MRLQLEDALREAARDDHDPMPLDAGRLTSSAAVSRRRRALIWLAALTSLALVAVAALWYRPRIGPAPQPTPSPAFTIDGNDPNHQTLPDDVVRQRCPTPAGKHLVDEASSPTAGGWLAFGPAGWHQSDAQGLTFCHLGAQNPSDQKMTTQTELHAGLAGLLDACQQHSGYVFDPTQWHALVAGPVTRDDSRERRALGIVGDSGWLATCTLATSGHPATVVFRKLAFLTSLACPQVDEDFDWAPGTSAATPLGIRSAGVVGITAIANANHRLDPTVSAIEVGLGDPVNVTLGRFPVHDGLAGIGGWTAVHHPERIPMSLQIPVSVRTYDAAGHLKQSCFQ